MRRLLTLAVCLASWQAAPRGPGPVHEDRPPHQAGVDAVKGQWRYHDVRIVEVAGKNKDGSANKTYSYEPKAKGPDFDDSKWEIIAPETLQERREATGRSASAGTGSRSPSLPRSRGSRSSSRPRSMTTARSGSTASSRAGRAIPAARSWPASTSPNRVELKDAQARQGLSDRHLRHQRADLGYAHQLDLPGAHVPGTGRQAVSEHWRRRTVERAETRCESARRFKS